MRILNETLSTAADASVTVTTAPLLLAYAFGYAIQASFTGSPVGTLVLQGSNDAVPNAQFTASPPTNWTAITGSSTSVSSSGLFLFNAGDVYYNWIRAVYTPSSGTGTLTVVGNAKGF